MLDNTDLDQSPYVQNYFGALSYQSKAFIILEYIPGVELYELMRF
jgi:hypothetical protein